VLNLEAGQRYTNTTCCDYNSHFSGKPELAGCPGLACYPLDLANKDVLVQSFTGQMPLSWQQLAGTPTQRSSTFLHPPGLLKEKGVETSLHSCRLSNASTPRGTLKITSSNCCFIFKNSSKYNHSYIVDVSLHLRPSSCDEGLR